MLSAILSIALSLGISAAAIGISKAWDQGEEIASANSGTTYQKALISINKLLQAAKKKGSDVLNDAISKLENASQLSSLVGSPAYSQVVARVQQEASDAKNKASKAVQDFEDQSNALQNEVSAYSAYSNRYRTSKQGKQDLADMQKSAEVISRNLERRLSDA